MAAIEIRDVAKRFGAVTALVDIDLDVADREFLVLLGASGCGKTTLLRLIAGLDKPSAGEIRIGGKRVNDLPPRARGIAMVFQNYAVFPHLTVFENIAFGLRMKKLPEAEIRGEGEALGGADAHRATAQALFRPAFRRPAPARRGRPGARHGAGGAAHGRAALQPRRASAPGDARRAEGRSPGEPHDHHLRHPRSGGGDEPRRPHRRHAWRAHRAGGNADRRLPRSGRRLRRRLHRQPAHELPAGQPQRRALAASPAPRSTGRPSRRAPAVRHPAGGSGRRRQRPQRHGARRRAARRPSARHHDRRRHALPRRARQRPARQARRDPDASAPRRPGPLVRRGNRRGHRSQDTSRPSQT